MSVIIGKVIVAVLLGVAAAAVAAWWQRRNVTKVAPERVVRPTVGVDPARDHEGWLPRPGPPVPLPPDIALFLDQRTARGRRKRLGPYRGVFPWETREQATERIRQADRDLRSEMAYEERLHRYDDMWGVNMRDNGN